jgi:hypothetical protein
MGDRNFGIFAIAWTAAQLQHDVLLRLTRPHAVYCRRAFGEGEVPLFFYHPGFIPDALGALFRRRWNVETDLRSIKQTVRLQQLSSRSPEMLEKDLLLAMAAYNLIRAVICLAAQKANVEPRRISFTNVYTLVETFLPDILTARTTTQWTQCWKRIISIATAYLLPNRTKPRSYPRPVWHRPTRRSRT